MPKRKKFTPCLKFGGFVLAFTVLVFSAHAEPPYARAKLGEVDAPRGEASDTYLIYRDFLIPIRYYNDREFPGFIKIIDHDDVLWVAKKEDLSRLLDKILPKELDRVLAEANRYYDGFLFDRALPEFKRLLRFLPSNPYINLRIAQSELMRRKNDTESVAASLDETFKYLDSSLKLAPQNAAVYNEYGLIAFQQGDLDKALGYFEKAASLSHKNEIYEWNVFETHLAKSDSYFADYNFSAAQNEIEKVMDDLPDFSDKDLPSREESVFRRYLSVNAESKAFRFYQNKTEEELWVNAGKYLEQGRLWPEAISLYQTLYEMTNQSKNFKNRLVFSFLRNGDELVAADRWDEAVRNYQDARPYIETEEQLNNAVGNLLREKGMAAYFRADWKEASIQFDRYYQIFPEKKDIRELLARSYFEIAQGYTKNYRYADALLEVEKARKVSEKRKYTVLAADLHVEMGLLEYASGRFFEAKEEFKAAYKTDPAHFRARRLYVQTLIRRFFAEDFWIATLVFAMGGSILFYLGLTLARFRKQKILFGLDRQANLAFSNGQWLEAIGFYEQYKRIAGRLASIEVFERLARCYTELKEYNLAILNYNRAEELLKGQKRFIIEKGKIFATKGNGELTAQVLRDSIDLAADSETLLQFCRERLQIAQSLAQKNKTREVMGAIHFLRGELSTARSVFEDLYRDNSRNRYAIRKLIEIYKKEKDLNNLRTYLMRYLEIDPYNASIIMELAEFYENSGKKKEALDRYAEAFEINPYEKAKKRIRILARDLCLGTSLEDAETASHFSSGTQNIKQVTSILMKIEDYATALEILQKVLQAGSNEVWIIKFLAICFDKQKLEDMAIKYYRRYLDYLRKESTDVLSISDEEKEAHYGLGCVYERKGLLDLALGEFQGIYEHDLHYLDVSFKVSDLQEKKLVLEKERATRELPFSKPLARPGDGQIRCPKCMGISPDTAAFCVVCNFKLGLVTEPETPKNPELPNFPPEE